ncbi:melanoma differentiation associated protein-like protein [Encephalitozoon hellem]|uniref:Melanoma differentiation associated protein-like protein n=1 Tax=Encephalitozoon hellem TaxID=27973 RepID=A0ABY8CK20_ENCHE|nr:melanoma differentiation associated protein-like protein [Encephalitozoon hellem]
MLLEYEEEALRECEGQSCLLVMGGGLNIQGIIREMIKQYLHKDSLVLLVNFSSEDESLLLRMESPFLQDIRSLHKTKRREKYRHGGVFIASNSVFLADMIDGVVDVEKVDAILVNNVEAITETSSESFIAHFFRSRNKTGVIRGFSESPVPLSLGFSPLDRKMKSLKLTRAVFFPRFHFLVEKSLRRDIDVAEIKFKMSERGSQLQVILLEIINNLLRIVFKGPSREEVDAETIIFGSVHKIFRQMNISNSRIMEDLYDIRGLIFLLFSCDPGTFYEYVKEIVKKQIELGKDGTWINLSISHVLIDESREYFEEAVEKARDLAGGDKKRRKAGTEKDELGDLPGFSNERPRTFYTLNPKIKKLVEILQEMKEASSVVLVSSRGVKNMVTRILVAFGLVSGECIEIQEGAVKVMTHYEFKYYEESYESAIFVESGQDSVRKIERYGVVHPVKVFFLMHSESLEEQRYLSEIRREKTSFEKLIEERARLPLRLDDAEDVIDLEENESGDGAYTVVIDSRELRAELPFFLFKARNKICISTLPIGDYLISPTVCIERKSIPDFTSSLNTGRLYLQASMMCYRYPNPILLLEFDGRPCLSDHYRYDQDTFKNSIAAKLALLLFNFGMLRIIWSESRLFSAKVIRDLQKKEDMPSISEGSKMDPVLREILLSIPGITQFNILKVRRYFKNLKDLVFCTIERLELVLGKENSILVHGFFGQETRRGNKTNDGAGEGIDG